MSKTIIEIKEERDARRLRERIEEQDNTIQLLNELVVMKTRENERLKAVNAELVELIERSVEVIEWLARNPSDRELFARLETALDKHRAEKGGE